MVREPNIKKLEFTGKQVANAFENLAKSFAKAENILVNLAKEMNKLKNRNDETNTRTPKIH